MRDTELYRHLLGLLEPWTVERVELLIEEQRVEVWATHLAGVRFKCPECAYEGTARDHAEERVWRHLDSCQFQTWLHARIPRVDCPEHGVRQARTNPQEGAGDGNDWDRRESGCQGTLVFDVGL